MVGPQLGGLLRLIDPRLLLDLLFATSLGVLVLGRITEARTLWLLRGYLLLVALAWVVQRYANLPLSPVNWWKRWCWPAAWPWRFSGRGSCGA